MIETRTKLLKPKKKEEEEFVGLITEICKDVAGLGHGRGRMQGIKQHHISPPPSSPAPSPSLSPFSISWCCFLLDWVQLQEKSLREVARTATNHSRSLFYHVIKFQWNPELLFPKWTHRSPGIEFCRPGFVSCSSLNQDMVQGMELSTSDWPGLGHADHITENATKTISLVKSGSSSKKKHEWIVGRENNWFLRSRRV